MTASFSGSPSPRPVPAAQATTLSVRSTDDLLAAVPVLLGFWPHESLVMLTFGCREPFHARVDLPPPELVGDALDAAVAELGRLLGAPASEHRAERVVVLVYSHDAARATALWHALDPVLGTYDVRVGAALAVTPRHWHALGPGGAPHSGGRAYDVSAHPFLAQAVLEGRVTHGSREALARTLDRDEVRAARTGAAVDALLPDLAERTVRPWGLLVEGRWAHRTVRRHLDEGGLLDDDDLVRLVAGLRWPRIRDAAWAAVTRATARTAVELWTDVVRRTPREHTAAPAALLAFAAWLAGNGALAWCALDRCAEDDAAYGLHGLLTRALEQALPPSVWEDGFDWEAGLEP